MTDIRSSVDAAYKKVARHPPKGVRIVKGSEEMTTVYVVGQGKTAVLSNWLFDRAHMRIRCVVAIHEPAVSLSNRRDEHTSGWGTPEEVIRGVAVGMAIGAYDKSPEVDHES